MHTLQEIHQQPSVWTEVISQLGGSLPQIDLRTVDEIIFTGCGSAYYLGLTAAEITRDLLNIPARAMPASEIIFYPERHVTPGAMLITASRSGRTSETLEAMHVFRRRSSGQVWGVTCAPESPFVEYCDQSVILPPITENSIVQTVSITSMTLAMLAMLAGSFKSVADLPSQAEAIMQQHDEAIRSLATSDAWSRVFYLGMGYLYGVANEANLKLKESALEACDALHTLEIRHGPSAMADEQALIVGLISPQTATHEARVLLDMHNQGAHVLSISNTPVKLPDTIQQIVLNSNLPSWAVTLLYQPLMQLLAVYRAEHKGIDPDQPAHLNPFVKLDGDLT